MTDQATLTCITFYSTRLPSVTYMKEIAEINAIKGKWKRSFIANPSYLMCSIQCVVWEFVFGTSYKN